MENFQKQPISETIKKLKEYIKYGNTEILDLGAGIGHNAIYLAEKGANVTAVDNDPNKITILQELTKKYKIKPTLANMKDTTTLPDELYDIIICTYVIEELTIEQIKKGADYVNEHIKEHGYLIVETDIKQKRKIKLAEPKFKDWEEIINQIKKINGEDNLEILIQKM